MVKAREVKELLSTKDEVQIDAVLKSGEEVHLSITAAQFNEITQHLVAKTMAPVRKALRDAGLTVEDVEGVVLVGGATRMPHIRRAVGEFFDQSADQHRPRQGGGAGRGHAGQPAGRQPRAGRRLAAAGRDPAGHRDHGRSRRSSAQLHHPCARAQEFTTFKDGQTAMAIHVVQGERELVADCRSLARFELRGIPPMAAGAARIRVTYQVDADGLLAVSAREMTSGVEASITVKPSYGLGDDEIARMLQESFSSADEDMQRRALREEQVEAERIVLATRSALQADAALLSEEERVAIEARRSSRDRRRARCDHLAIKAAVDALAHGTEEFAARRMDRSVHAALAGKKLDEVA
jgi:molecular chaperone HscA